MAETNDNGGRHCSACRSPGDGGASGGNGPPRKLSRMEKELTDTNNKSKVTWTPQNEKR